MHLIEMLLDRSMQPIYDSVGQALGLEMNLWDGREGRPAVVPAEIWFLREVLLAELACHGDEIFNPPLAIQHKRRQCLEDWCWKFVEFRD